MDKFVYRVKVEDALSWELNNTCLSYELTDEAYRQAPVELRESDGDTTLEIEGDEFVVTFYPDWTKEGAG